jgi:hypothetical protein
VPTKDQGPDTWACRRVPSAGAGWRCAEQTRAFVGPRRGATAPLDKILVATDAALPDTDAVPRSSQRLSAHPAHCACDAEVRADDVDKLCTATAANTDEALSTHGAETERTARPKRAC